jgi:hypothetical protein
MAGYGQQTGERGSLKWIQRLINDRSDLLEKPLRKQFKIAPDVRFEWKSPLKHKGFEEYRDADFLKAICMGEHIGRLQEFWPRRGPQWDALGVLSDGTALLVEAKAHLSELLSRCSARSPASVEQIANAFRQTTTDLGVTSPNPWETPFYQYANRIAHLHFLTWICNEKAILVFADFMGDREMGGPASCEEWRGATDLIHAYLGILHNPILENVAHICIDVRAL